MTVAYCSSGVQYEEYSGANPVPKALKLPDVPSVLHVVAVVSNPCNYTRRYKLACEFLKRIKDTPGIALYVVELCYGDQEFVLTGPNMKRELQLRTETPLWHKESMVNCAVAKLLPASWKYMAWIDTDLEWSATVNANADCWATDALKVLQVCSVVQLFSQVIDMDAEGSAMNVFQGMAYQYVNKMKRGNGANFFHPGFAWAVTRTFYDQMDGLLDTSILGSADHHMACSWLGEDVRRSAVDGRNTQGYQQSVHEFAERSYSSATLGYIPYIVKHHYHGSKKNRGYTNRWQILIDHAFDPKTMLTRDDQGLVVPTDAFPTALKSAITKYFVSRCEDD